MAFPRPFPRPFHAQEGVTGDGSVFIGNPTPAATSGARDAQQAAHVWWYGGNSVLLDLGGRRYLYIGFIIFSFTALDDIHTYVSTMGNSAVPYPYGIGTKNTYCMIEQTYIPNHIIKLHE